MYSCFLNVKYFKKKNYNCIHFKLEYQIKFYDTETFTKFANLIKQS